MKGLKFKTAMFGGACTIFFSGAAQALDVTYIPRLEVGMESYELKVDGVFKVGASGSVLSSSAIEYDDTVPVASGGITIVADQFYIDFSGQKSFEGDDDWSRSLLDTSSPIAFADVRGSMDFDRYEYAIAFGYLVAENLSVFFGYRESKSDSEFSSVITAPQFGDIGTAKVDMDFEEEGFFVGASYGWHVNNSTFNGVLSGSVAFASLDGDLKQKSVATTGLIDVDGVPDDSSKGDTLGVKLGLTWKGITQVDKLTYTVGVNGYKYEFDADGDDPDITETVVNFKLGLAYVF